MENLSDILELPTVINNVHESSFKSYYILGYVLKLIKRGDSKETVFEIVDFLTNFPNPKPIKAKN